MIFPLEAMNLASLILLINAKVKLKLSAGVREQNFLNCGKRLLLFPLLWHSTVIFSTGNYINLSWKYFILQSRFGSQVINQLSYYSAIKILYETVGQILWE